MTTSFRSTFRETHVYNKFLTLLAKDKTSLTPREIVHPPERIERQPEGEGRDGENIEDHPSNHIPLPSQNKDEGL